MEMNSLKWNVFLTPCFLLLVCTSGALKLWDEGTLIRRKPAHSVTHWRTNERSQISLRGARIEVFKSRFLSFLLVTKHLHTQKEDSSRPSGPTWAPLPSRTLSDSFAEEFGGKSRDDCRDFSSLPRQTNEVWASCGRTSELAGRIGTHVCVCDHQGNRNEEDRERLRERAKRERRVS